MSVSFKYWDDCVNPQDMEALWMDPEVRTEWVNAGETKGQKVHLSRDPDGQPYLTQTELKAVAAIIVGRHFVSQIDSDMICAIAELESDRQPTATRYNKKTKETTVGIMQILPKTADWLTRELGYRAYEVEGDSKILYMPFVNAYLGAAYLRWLSNFDQKERSEEFIVRAYKGGTKKATHKSTLQYWRRYLSVKESLPSRKVFEVHPMVSNPSASAAPVQQTTGAANTTWDSRASPEDMEEIWNNPNVSKEWSKSGEKKGKVRFSHDAEKRPYLSRVELRAVADIILSKHFSTRTAKPTALCALAEIVSMRFVNGVGPRLGIMGIDYPTSCWLYKYVNSIAETKSFILIALQCRCDGVLVRRLRTPHQTELMESQLPWIWKFCLRNKWSMNNLMPIKLEIGQLFELQYAYMLNKWVNYTYLTRDLVIFRTRSLDLSPFGDFTIPIAAREARKAHSSSDLLPRSRLQKLAIKFDSSNSDTTHPSPP